MTKVKIVPKTINLGSKGQIGGQWKIDESVLSSASSDFKTMPIWYQDGITKFEKDKK